MYHGRPDHEVIQDTTPGNLLAAFVLMWISKGRLLSDFEVSNLTNMAQRVLGRDPNAEPMTMMGAAELSQRQLRIPMNMPVFTIFGKDPVGAEAVEEWIRLSRDNGSAEDILASAQAQANRMREWGAKNRVSDIPAGTPLSSVVSDRLPPNS
jgi:hypothetical protein